VLLTEQSAELSVCLAANLNSLTHDFVVRQKVGGMNLSYYFIEQFPILSPAVYDTTALTFIVPRILELTYTSNSMQPFAEDLAMTARHFPGTTAAARNCALSSMPSMPAPMMRQPRRRRWRDQTGLVELRDVHGSQIAWHFLPPLFRN
jgi:hypothetical protein